MTGAGARNFAQLHVGGVENEMRALLAQAALAAIACRAHQFDRFANAEPQPAEGAGGGVDIRPHQAHMVDVQR